MGEVPRFQLGSWAAELLLQGRASIARRWLALTTGTAAIHAGLRLLARRVTRAMRAVKCLMARGEPSIRFRRSQYCLKLGSAIDSCCTSV